MNVIHMLNVISVFSLILMQIYINSKIGQFGIRGFTKNLHIDLDLPFDKMEEAFRLFKSTREYFTPVLTSTAFYERGLLTPEEFVRAGDHLIRTCPSWKWESGEKSKQRPYLPPNKQFLITRSVPSYSRLSILQSSKLVEETYAGEMGEGGGDWCAPNLVIPKEDDDEVLVDASDAADGNLLSDSDHLKPPAIPAANRIDDEYVDMEDESLALDEASTQRGTIHTNIINHSNPSVDIRSNAFIRARRYDVSITYDNYYRVPRIWLFGFDENGSALSPNAVFQDIMQDYAEKTVTIDPHPHTSLSHGIDCHFISASRCTAIKCFFSISIYSSLSAWGCHAAHSGVSQRVR